MQAALGLAFGAVVGFSLGLTGGGGSIFAVPLLVYGLAVRPREAVGDLAGRRGGDRPRGRAATAGTGRGRGPHRAALRRRRDARGAGGLVAGPTVPRGPPAGPLRRPDARRRRADVGAGVTEARGGRAVRAVSETRPASGAGRPAAGTRAGRLTLTSRCFAVLVAAGLATGVLSGLFGVGGGFVDRPGPGARHRHGHPPGRRHLAAGHRPGRAPRAWRRMSPPAARCPWR